MRACLWQRCKQPASQGRLCALHGWYAREFLADPHWRDHEPPEPRAVAHLMVYQERLL